MRYPPWPYGRSSDRGTLPIFKSPLRVKVQDKKKTSMAGTVAERVALFRPDVQPFLWALHALVKDGAWTAAMVVDAPLFAGSFFDKKESRALKIRKMQALIDIVTLPEKPT